MKRNRDRYGERSAFLSVEWFVFSVTGRRTEFVHRELLRGAGKQEYTVKPLKRPPFQAAFLYLATLS
ncbi:MAG: hypothetical protein HGB36_09330 [Chlorobiaceae bacterium]|nr:hypothetical protein [Chlorobiaceae bacterium]